MEQWLYSGSCFNRKYLADGTAGQNKADPEFFDDQY